MKNFAGIIFLAVAAMAASPAAADVDEFRAGVLAQSCCGQGTSKEQGAAINAEVLFDAPRFLSVLGAPRPVIGATVALDPDATSQFYGGFEWLFDVAPRWFVAGMVGGAVHNGETDRFDQVADNDRVDHTLFLGCRAQFRLGASAGYRITDNVNASIHWSHMSNAGLCSENEGLDHLGFRVGWEF